MDLSTMSKKLANHEYDTMESVKADLDLIIANCRRFNPPYTFPTDQADLFEKLVEKEWSKALMFRLSPVERKRLAAIISELMTLPQ
jgi:transcription initiation factor TFIID subunit 2